MIELRTARLRLIPLELEPLRQAIHDYAAVESHLGTATTGRQIGEPLRSAISANIRQIQRHPAAILWYTNWQIVLLEANRVIGSIGFKGFPDQSGTVEIGYGLDLDYRNRGYTTEAVERLVAWALAQPGVQMVTAETMHGNAPSMRVLQKVGMELNRITGDALYWQLSAVSHRRLSRPEWSAPMPPLLEVQVTVDGADGRCPYATGPGDSLTVRGGRLWLPPGGGFCLQALDTLLPYLTSSGPRGADPAVGPEQPQIFCRQTTCRLGMRLAPPLQDPNA